MRTGGNDFLSAKIFKAAGKFSEPVIRQLVVYTAAVTAEYNDGAFCLRSSENTLMHEIVRFTLVPHADAHIRLALHFNAVDSLQRERRSRYRAELTRDYSLLNYDVRIFLLSRIYILSLLHREELSLTHIHTHTHTHTVCSQRILPWYYDNKLIKCSLN